MSTEFSGLGARQQEAPAGIDGNASLRMPRSKPDEAGQSEQRQLWGDTAGESARSADTAHHSVRNTTLVIATHQMIEVAN